MKRHISLIPLLLPVFFVLVRVAEAQTLVNPLSFNTITDFFLALLDILLIFAFPVVIFFIMYAGFLFVTAQGNEMTLSRARSAFTWAVIGGVIVLGARAIISVIQGTVAAL